MKGDTIYNIKIYNILKQIGLCPKIKGTKLLLSAILISIDFTNDFIIVSDLYKQLSLKYNISPENIENSISYSLKHLVGNKYKENFKNVFGIEFCEDYYTNKTIIEEVRRVIITEKYNYKKSNN